MKFSHIAAVTLALLLGLHVANAQVIVLSNFGDSAAGFGSWTYNPTTSTLSGSEGFGGNSLFGTPITADIGTDRYIQLSANATVVPPGAATFTITLGDGDSVSNSAIATFKWSDFIGGATITQPLAYTTFNFSALSTWSLASGTTNDSLNISFTNLSAVPEPSTYLLMLGGLSVLWFVNRRRSQLALRPVAIRSPR